MIKFTTKSYNTNLTKEHIKNLKKLDKNIELVYEEFNKLFKDKPIRSIFKVKQKPNSYYILTSDEYWSEVEITSTLSDTYQFKIDFNIKEPMFSSIQF